MQQIAQFFKVSEEQFVRDWCTATRRSADEAKKVYQNIQLPRRATKGSAGYDFFAPESFTLVPHETILIPVSYTHLFGVILFDNSNHVLFFLSKFHTFIIISYCPTKSEQKSTAVYRRSAKHIPIHHVLLLHCTIQDLSLIHILHFICRQLGRNNGIA